MEQPKEIETCSRNAAQCHTKAGELKTRIKAAGSPNNDTDDGGFVFTSSDATLHLL